MEKKKTDFIQRSYNYAFNIIKLTDTFDNKDHASITITKQLLRSATSIGANIIEAQAASSRKDFTRFINYSLKSANECKFWLLLLKDVRKTTNNECNILLKETIELANILAKSILTLKKKN